MGFPVFFTQGWVRKDGLYWNSGIQMHIIFPWKVSCIGKHAYD